MTLPTMLRRCDLGGIKVTWTVEPRGWSVLASSSRMLVRARARTGVGALHAALQQMGLA